ncbi:hypothetical protein ACJX0J_006522, partial [Zea mays]
NLRYSKLFQNYYPLKACLGARELEGCQLDKLMWIEVTGQYALARIGFYSSKSLRFADGNMIFYLIVYFLHLLYKGNLCQY